MKLELLTQIPAANDESMYRYIILGKIVIDHKIFCGFQWLETVYIYIERERYRSIYLMDFFSIFF